MAQSIALQLEDLDRQAYEEDIPSGTQQKNDVINENVNELGKGQEHSFINDQTHVEEMEEELLTLLQDFKENKLNAFDENFSLDKMKEIKEMQQNLAKLHFDLEDDESTKAIPSEEERVKQNQDKMDKLMKNLQEICSSIQSLHQHLDTE